MFKVNNKDTRTLPEDTKKLDVARVKSGASPLGRLQHPNNFVVAMRSGIFRLNAYYK